MRYFIKVRDSPEKTSFILNLEGFMFYLSMLILLPFTWAAFILAAASGMVISFGYYIGVFVMIPLTSICYFYLLANFNVIIFDWRERKLKVWSVQFIIPKLVRVMDLDKIKAVGSFDGGEFHEIFIQDEHPIPFYSFTMESAPRFTKKTRENVLLLVDTLRSLVERRNVPIAPWTAGTGLHQKPVKLGLSRHRWIAWGLILLSASMFVAAFILSFFE